MLIWSDLYYLVKSRHGQSIPPIEKGIEVCITLKYRFQKDIINSFETTFFVKVTDVIGDEIVAKTTKKIDHLKQNEILIFDKSFIESVYGGWEYACMYQSVRVSKGVYYNKNTITDIRGWSVMAGPLETGITVYSAFDDNGDYDPDDWVKLSIPKLLSFVPHIEEVLKKGTSDSLIGDLYLPIDTIERDDNEDEWQYHNNR
jgi:hypothetical protein